MNGQRLSPPRAGTVPRARIRYQAPPRKPEDTSRLDIAMEEAEAYLRRPIARQQASRANHVVAGLIGVAGLLILAWLIKLDVADHAKKSAPGPAPVLVASQAAIPPVSPPMSPAPPASLTPLLAPSTVHKTPSLTAITPAGQRQTQTQQQTLKKPAANSRNAPQVTRQTQTVGNVTRHEVIPPAITPDASTRERLNREAEWREWMAQEQKQRQRQTARRTIPLPPPAANDGLWGTYRQQRRVTESPDTFGRP